MPFLCGLIDIFRPKRYIKHFKSPKSCQEEKASSLSSSAVAADFPKDTDNFCHHHHHFRLAQYEPIRSLSQSMRLRYQCIEDLTIQGIISKSSFNTVYKAIWKEKYHVAVEVIEYSITHRDRHRSNSNSSTTTSASLAEHYPVLSCFINHPNIVQTWHAAAVKLPEIPLEMDGIWGEGEEDKEGPPYAPLTPLEMVVNVDQNQVTPDASKDDMIQSSSDEEEDEDAVCNRHNNRNGHAHLLMQQMKNETTPSDANNGNNSGSKGQFFFDDGRQYLGFSPAKLILQVDVIIKDEESNNLVMQQQYLQHPRQPAAAAPSHSSSLSSSSMLADSSVKSCTTTSSNDNSMSSKRAGSSLCPTFAEKCVPLMVYHQQRPILDLLQRASAAAPHQHKTSSSRNKNNKNQADQAADKEYKEAAEFDSNQGSGGLHVEPGAFELWLLNEYCDIGSLNVIINQESAVLYNSLTGNPRMMTLMKILQDVCCGLQALHTAGVAHGALFANNVLLQSTPTTGYSYYDNNESTNFEGATTEGWVAKLANAGISNIVNFSVGTRLRKSALGISSPEILMTGKPSMEGDVYGFGMLMAHLWMKKEPWRDVSSRELVQKMIERPGVDNNADVMFQCRDAPGWFLRLMRNCLEFYPQNRPSSEMICRTLTVEMKKLENAVVKIQMMMANRAAAAGKKEE
jgi:serine/threonine protein kinase